MKEWIPKLMAKPEPAGLIRNEVGAKYFSHFGGLWTDRKDADEVLERLIKQAPRLEQWAQPLTSFIRDGYVIFKNAVSDAAIDQYLSDLRDHTQLPVSPLKVSVPAYGPLDKGVVPLNAANLGEPLSKILDTFAHLPSARPLVFNDTVAQFLRIVFEEGLWAFQGLHFERGSTQAIHQDTAYVVSSKPLQLCASWLALEDVQPGSGELIYYPGSHHQFADWLYSKRYKHYNTKRDAHEEHLAHLDSLALRAQQHQLPLQHFLPQKGDVLIWSADLAHGGSTITDSSLTRRSLVTHFSPASCVPHYLRFRPSFLQGRQEYATDCYYTSMYYD